MRRFFFLTLMLLGLAVVLPGSLRAASVDDGGKSARLFLLRDVVKKIERPVLDKLQKGEPTRALIVMAEQADVSAARNLKTKLEKGTYVFNTLRATAERTQAGVRAELDRLGISYRAYYVTNVIAVENLDANSAAQIAARPEVGRIANNPDVKFSEPLAPPSTPKTAESVTWGIQKIQADKLWAMGIRGKGIVVANQDTGVQWNHPALIKEYRGYDKKKGKAVHSYNWWDAIHSAIVGNPNPCGYSSKKPCADQPHGTHTMGTMVGHDGATKIGVAPQAQWIGCHNMDQNVGRPSTYIECFEFFLAPWDKKGNHPDVSKAPDVVSNSWGCPPEELCEPDSLKTATENLRAAGIFVAVSAGNSGPDCSTVSDPSPIYDASTTIGATDSSDNLAYFSSRGPVTADSSNRRKPDISAPGVGVYSSVPQNGYGYLSGTSMASPHVAGAVALLWSAKPALRGDVDATETLLFNSAVTEVAVSGGSQDCGGTTPSDIPNNFFGYGRLDALKAYQDAP